MGDFSQVQLNPLVTGETKKRGGLDFRVYQDLKTGIHRDLLNKIDLEKVATQRDDRTRRQVFGVIQELVSTLKTPLSGPEKERLSLEVLDEVFGLGPLEPLLQDPTISDILVNGAKEVFVERAGVLEDTPIMFDPAPFYFAAPRNASPDLLDIIDRHLSEMKKDPRSAYYAALERWTSEEVQFKLPPWLGILGLVAGVVLIMSLLGSLVLRRQVTARTRELKQTNDELRGSEQRYRHLFEHNPAPMLIYQRGTLEMLAVNDAFVNHYGYSREEALKLVLTDLYPDDEKESIARAAAGLKGHAYVGEWHHRKADGSIITIMVRSHDIDYWGHNARIAVISDITETKRMEAELRHINETLDQKVRERTVELEKKNDELEAANERLTEMDRLKSMFIASMSHELRTPLNSVIGYSSVILNEWLGPVGPEQKEKLAIVLRAGKHLLSLINDVIDVSKIEAGQLDVHVEEFDLFDLVAEAAHQLQPDMGGKGLAFSADSVHARLRTDRRRLLQALLNILSNAMKYTVEGSVRLSVKLDDQWAEIAVCDTGIGIGEQDAEKIFKPFVRVDSHLRGTVPGTGLGLYLTHKLVDDILKGEIFFTSRAGQGSTFTIRVPIDSEERSTGVMTCGNNGGIASQ